MYFIPSQRWIAFGNLHSIRHIADDLLGFVLHTITGFHRPSFTHYYGFICHLTPTLSLAFTLIQRFRHLPGCGARLPQLLHWLPVNNATLKHSLGLTEYRASRYFARLPTKAAETGGTPSLHLRCVLLTSYRFLQTLPLASNALAIQIIFPSVGVIQVSFNLTGLPASLGKQKTEHLARFRLKGVNQYCC